MLVAVILCGAGSAWGETVTYTVSSTKAVTTSGTAPSGSSASYSQTYGTKCQMTRGNSATLTLAGFNNLKITNITLSAHSNSSAGSGSFSYSIDGGTTFTDIIATNQFKHSSWHGSWSSAYVDVSKDVNITPTDGTVVLKIEATVNSLFCESYTITYEPVSTSAVATTTTIDDTGITNTDVYAGTTAGSLAATVSADGTAISGASVTWHGNNDNVATINASTGAVTLVAAGSVTFTASYAGVSGQYQASSATYEMTVTSSDPAEILDYTSLGLENAAELGIQNAENFSATAEQGTNTNNSPKYYTSDNTARFYAGNTLTISSNTNKKIAKIEFNVNVDATVNTGSLSNNMWIGSATTVVFTMPKVSIKTIKVTFENENLNDPELSFPTTAFEVEAGATFTAPTLTNPHSLQVTYSSSNADIATVNETTGAVTIGNTPGTVTITATFEGNDVYSFGSASYTITVSTVLSNIAALTALEEDGEYQVNLTDALVTYIHGKNVYLEDASGAVLLYDCAEGLAVGDKINGTADVTYTVYHNLPEVTAITLHEDYTKTSGNTVTPTEVTIAELNENFTSYISRYVKIVEATVTSEFDDRSAKIKQGEASIDLRDQNSNATLTATVDDIVTVTAHPAIYNTTKQIAVYEQSQIVVKPIEKIDPTIVVEDASIAFGSSYTIDTELIEGGEINVTSGNTSIATVNGLTITPIAVGSVEITVNTAESNQYNAGSETFTLTITQPEGKTTAAPTGGSGNFVKVTSTNDITNGDYLIVSEDDALNLAFDGSLNTLDAEGNNIQVEISNNEIVATGKTTAAVFTIEVVDGGYSIKSASGLYIGQTSDANGLKSSQSEVYVNLITIDTEGDANIVSGKAHLRYNGASNQDRFRYYKSSSYTNQSAVQLYKLSGTAPAISYTIPASGYGTFCSEYPLDLSKLPEGVKAYGVESQSDASVTLSEITTAVKGGTGLIIKGTGGTEFNFESVDCSTSPNNLLKGTLAPTYLPAGTAWGLKNGKFQPNLAGTLPAHKAYLPAETSTGGAVKELIIVFNDADGITTTRTITDAATIYDLTGRRLQSTQKGVNIVNGKKILVK